MDEHFYQLTMIVLIASFILARTPFVIQYKKTYRQKNERRKSPLSINLDKILVGLNFFAWVVFPILWASGFFSSGEANFPDVLRVAGILLYGFGVVLMWMAHHFEYLQYQRVTGRLFPKLKG